MRGTRRALPWVLSLACVPCAACGSGEPVGAGAHPAAEAPSTGAVDLDGAPFELFGEGSVRIVVLLFVSVDCPISNRYAPEVGRLHAEFAPRGVDFRLVYTDPEETPDAIREHVADYAYPFGAVRDPRHGLAQLVGASVTPEAAVLVRGLEPEEPPGSGLGLAYRGRIDDTWADYGKNRPRPTRRDLREALLAVTQGRPVTVARTTAVGCFIAPLED